MHFPFPLKRTLHAFPALRPRRVLLKLAPLGQPPSLHLLRNLQAGLVRKLPWYYGAVRLPMTTHHRLTSSDFPIWPLFPCEQRQSWDLPIPVQGVSVRAWGLRPRREQTPLALSMRPLLPSASSHHVGSLNFNRIPRLHTQPARAPVNASLRPLRSSAHDSGSMWFATPSSYDSFIHDTSPVFIGAIGTSYIVFVKRKKQETIKSFKTMS